MPRKKSWKHLNEVREMEPELDSFHWKTLRDKSSENQEAKKSLVVIKAKTINQQHYINLIESCALTICSGVAGTGKTYIACGIAAKMLNDGKIQKIILSRPIVGCGKDLGSLPGTLSERTDPYMIPMFEAFGDFFSPVDLKKHFENKTIEVCPLETMRGRNFDHAVMILDEAQNATKKQVKMFLTRMCPSTKVIICGDLSQSDFLYNEDNPLPWIIQKLEHGNDNIGVAIMTKDDIQRHGLIRFILERLES